MLRLVICALFCVSASASEIRIQVKGMVCGFCAQGITKKFSKEPAVKNVDVALDKDRVTLTLLKAQDISDERIAELIGDAGFTAGKIERVQ